MFKISLCVILFFALQLQSSNCYEIQPRILNGTSSVRGQFKFFALLFFYKRFEPKYPYTCGATLINRNFVLTAAHCLNNVTKVAVHLGSLRQYNYEEGRHVFFARRKHFYIHPDYQDEELFNDIALIKLSRPAIYSDLIQPVTFPKICEVPSEMELIAIGNGYNQTDGEPSEILQYTTLTTVPHSECAEKFALLDDKPSFCAKGDSTAICQGDSGGPIVDPMDHSLYGISSFTDTDGCEVMPQGFTTVMYYLPWISEVTGMQFMDCD